MEATLLRELLNLEEAIRLMSTAQSKPDLAGHFRRIDGLTEQLPRNSDPTLLHYLHKKSYQKARLWLQGREQENQAGTCRHVE